jgi:putative ABC transport system ATP-binding protein
MQTPSITSHQAATSRNADTALVLRLIRAGKDYVGEGAPVRALDDVSLEVRRGEFVALVGRSGCGKSTLLNLAGAMDFPTRGQVLLNGVDTSQLDDAGLTRVRREQVGFIFQFFQLLPTLTAAENVELPLLLAGQRNVRSIAVERLRWVEMDQYTHRYPHQLSGGQMQRVAIARALVHSPQLLLADEPIGNLDTTTGNAVLTLLRRTASELGATILMATHSLESVAMADTVVRLRDGRIEEVRREGTPSEPPPVTERG